MLATAEHIHREGPFGPVETIWHRPADPAACDGDCDYHPIACGDPGISVPGGLREVPDVLSEPRQRWCRACRPDMASDGVTPDEAQAGKRPAPPFSSAPTVRTEVTWRRDDGGPLTDGDFAALERLLAAYRRAGTSRSCDGTGSGGAVNSDRPPARRTPPPVNPFVDEVTALGLDAGIPAWVRVTRPPLENLARRQPPARTDDGGTTA
ncbi:hypothetical protein [Streptomyces sp. NPDC007088]|uniref:hypothetical protein n=1 Tax=Streptomyces sp. NPDC007088 TaxID=3364773 RepID=UPI0036CA95AD